MDGLPHGLLFALFPSFALLLAFLKGNTFFHFLPSWWMYRFIAGLHLSAGKEIFWSFLFLLAYFFLSFLLYHLCSSLPFLPPLKGKSFIPLKGLAFPYSGILLFTVREAKAVARDLELITYTLLGLTWILGLTALLRSAHLDHALMALLPAASYLSIAVLSPFPLTARGRKGERDPLLWASPFRIRDYVAGQELFYLGFVSFSGIFFLYLVLRLSGISFQGSILSQIPCFSSPHPWLILPRCSSGWAAKTSRVSWRFFCLFSESRGPCLWYPIVGRLVFGDLFPGGEACPLWGGADPDLIGLGSGSGSWIGWTGFPIFPRG